MTENTYTEQGLTELARQDAIAELGELNRELSDVRELLNAVTNDRDRVQAESAQRIATLEQGLGTTAVESRERAQRIAELETQLREQIEDSERARRQRDYAISERQGLQQRWDALAEDLLSEAESRGWCSDYDDFAAKHDLPPRERDYLVEAFVTVRVTRTITARDEDQAIEMAEQDESEWAEQVYNLSSYDIDVTDLSVQGAEVA